MSAPAAETVSNTAPHVPNQDSATTATVETPAVEPTKVADSNGVAPDAGHQNGESKATDNHASKDELKTSETSNGAAPAETVPAKLPEKLENGTETKDKVETSIDEVPTEATKADANGKADAKPIVAPVITNDVPPAEDVAMKDTDIVNGGEDVKSAETDKDTTAEEAHRHSLEPTKEAAEEQPPAKKQKTAPVKDSNNDKPSTSPKRSASTKKKETKNPATGDVQPRRSSRLAT